KISIDKALEISQALGWSWRESQLFLQTAQLGTVKSKRAKLFLKKEIKKTESLYGQFKNLKLTQFSSVSNWYHLAILELTAIQGFSDEPSWIAKRLGIHQKEAELAIHALKEKKLIVQNESGEWKKNINSSVQDAPSSDIRKFHRQHLSHAAEAIEQQEFQRRHFSGVTMAINTDQLPEAIELVREFRSRMNSLLEAGTKKNVYHLAIQLYQLDKEISECPVQKGQK
ncbi:MAG: DUF4423 domain-containing protein, partial [Pseudobdellovibrionaceae bacterium]